MQIKIRVVTGAKKERILRVREHLPLGDLGISVPSSRASGPPTGGDRDNPYEYKVYVSAPPEKGKANERVVELVAEFFKVSRRNVSISSGHKSKEKTIIIND